jgi:hypothetical protein
VKAEKVDGGGGSGGGGNNDVGTNRENMKASDTLSLGYYEMKQHKPWSDEECSKLLDQRNQAKLQQLLDPSQIKEKI